MPHVVLLGTGGTIASRRRPAGGSVATDSGADLLTRVDGLDPAITVETIDVIRVNSFNITPADIRAVAEAAAAALARDDVDGVVVAHGTDTLEETAALLGLVHDDDRPVVLTGAQRAADERDGDGPRNLRDAIAVAADPEARGLGVLVVFAGTILPALGTRKAHTLAAQPFATAPGAVLGSVDGSAEIRLRPAPRAPLPRPTAAFDATRVDLVLAHPGADATLLDASVGAGARGAVVLGTGSGNPGRELTNGIARATDAGVVIALGSRTGSGGVVPIYGSGGAVDAVAAGAVPIGALPATQARVLLALLLSHDPDPAAVRRRLGDLCSS